MLKKILFASLIILTPTIIEAQGCSDAGICSMPIFDTTQVSTNRSNLSLEQTWELGEQKVQYLHTILTYSFKASEKVNISAMAPLRNNYYNQQWYSYMSDITVALQYNTKKTLAFSAGVKLPIGTVTAIDSNGEQLPMALQGGLGTYDLLLQALYTKHKWMLAAGYQHPLGAIDNTFEPSGNFSDFQNSYHLDRGDDVMLRYNRLWNSKQLQWMVSLVSVYRIKGDYIYNRQRVAGSEGISLNIGIQAIRSLNKGNLKVRIAVPVYVRKSRPDGLTRTFILGLSWEGFL